MPSRIAFSLCLVVCFFLGNFSHADTVIEYLLSEQDTPLNGGQLQPVWVKEGKLLIKHAGGSRNTDVLFNQALDSLIIINHKNRTFVPLNEEKIGRIAQQTAEMAPVVRGLNEQLRKLSPKQRAKWEEMLGDFPLGEITQDKEGAPSSIKTVGDKIVNGFACQQMDVFTGDAKTAELCLADRSTLNLSGEDFATIRSLLSLTERMVSKAGSLASQFGIKVPQIAIRNLAGVPIEMKDFSNENKGHMTLKRIASETITAESLQVPAGYRAEELTLWR